MQPEKLVVKLTVTMGLAIILLPACGRAPDDQPPTDVERPVVQETQTIVSLPLPQSNPKIGVTVISTPDGTALTYNDQYWIQLTETNQPTIEYAIVADTELAYGAAAASVEEFETNLLKYEDGVIIDHGIIDTVLGAAAWSSGTYSEDGEAMEMVYLRTTHPSGDGNLILTSTCPPNSMPIEDRLERLREIIAGIDL